MDLASFRQWKVRIGRVLELSVKRKIMSANIAANLANHSVRTSLRHYGHADTCSISIADAGEMVVLFEEDHVRQSQSFSHLFHRGIDNGLDSNGFPRLEFLPPAPKTAEQGSDLTITIPLATDELIQQAVNRVGKSVSIFSILNGFRRPFHA